MSEIRNIAIIAHVDHGKTTLVDQILHQAKVFRDNEVVQECFLDNNDLERERGITILSKNISINYKNTKINVIDTPGHSDFGGQVERVLKLADGVILLVDSAEGPMPQTRFVLDKALQLNLRPVVVINKIDKPDARPDAVHDKVFDLFCELNASDEQLDFPVLYASGRDGWAVRELDDPRESIYPLLDAIIEFVPAPPKVDGPVQCQVATLDYSNFVGRIGIGRVYRGTLDTRKPLVIVKRDGRTEPAQVKQLFTFEGIGRKETSVVECGDLCAIVGISDIDISDTICDAEQPEAMPVIAIDEPTISMLFRINDSPFFGREGKYVGSRQLRERLFKEVERDVALRVEDVNGEAFKVSGRGVLHLAILIETMRREGYEFAVAKPQVICKEIDGVKNEPIERLSVDVPADFAGRIIEMVGMRRGELIQMESRGQRQLLEFYIPTRGLIGLRSKALTASQGEAIVSHLFDHYEPFKGAIPSRTNGTMVSMGNGKSIPFAIDGLQQRGEFFIEPGVDCYEGMIVGEHCKEGDLVVNVQRAKQLTNMRAAGSDRNMKIAPARKMSLEQALEYIEDDELVEVTPLNIRLRKFFLTELERRRQRGRLASELEEQ
ncbi:translational GTPase TypA [Victivallis vadensis]|uniref:Large ribosomal subunit assembly factor BipA n=1 Tax=Victivallis vadensis TaxID=172901 RepID=A0A2U1AT11_9BACT|nr:translational GTPase TypA [Victivallis vadensis]NMD86339.1 translational GTPase TypA [Victivallis vadensis]PVY39565.1 GTP-binding protein TypA/BipA [Victivallis vadensis]PWM81397.1 MAG: translational GTPase TypA [Lentisphaerota bacterium]HJH02915.1 translational GTPase TypA [Victivallis vadensis]